MCVLSKSHVQLQLSIVPSSARKGYEGGLEPEMDLISTAQDSEAGR